MATTPLRHNFVLEILRLFQKRVGRTPSWTTEEIAAEIIISYGSQWPFSRRIFFDQWDSPDIKTLQQFTEAALHSLADLGLLIASTDREESSGFQRWEIASSWQPPEPPQDRGNGPGAPDGGDNDGDDGDGGGGGIREALGHPVLFALDSEDFDALADNLFSEVRE